MTCFIFYDNNCVGISYLGAKYAPVLCEDTLHDERGNDMKIYFHPVVGGVYAKAAVRVLDTLLSEVTFVDTQEEADIVIDEFRELQLAGILLFLGAENLKR